MSNIDLENIVSMEELLSDSMPVGALKEGRIETGRIAEKNENGILLDIGLKAESFIPKSDFPNNWEELEVRQEVFLELRGRTAPSGQRAQGRAAATWDKI